VANFVDILRQAGVPIDDMTPQPFYNHKHRGEEIIAWLEQHPEVEKYVILDDDDDAGDGVNGWNLASHFIQTSPQNGLLDEHVNQLVNMLNG
jgi:hypothetical protein